MSNGSDDLDIVSAIWILASNDETFLITYQGIKHRLDLAPDTNVKAIIAKRPELFRPGANPEHLEAWKEKMLQGRSLPSWVKAIASQQEREAAIRGISTEHVFRSQFRARRDAERSPIEIIKWGLDHLDRLRKAKAEANDASAKKWQMWLVFGVTLAGVVSQFLIAYAKFKGWI